MSNGKGRRARVNCVVVGARQDMPGRIVVTDPEERRKLSPPPSPEAVRRMEELERSSAYALHRMRSIRMD